MRADLAAQFGNWGLGQTLRPGEDKVRHAHPDPPPGDAVVIHSQLPLLGLPRHLERQGHGSRTSHLAYDRARACLDDDRVFGPAQVKRQARGAAGAVQTQISWCPICVEVMHTHTASIPFEQKNPIGPQRKAAAAPSSNLLRSRFRLRLYQCKEIVAASRDLIEGAHGTRTSISSITSLSLPIWSTAMTA